MVILICILTVLNWIISVAALVYLLYFTHDEGEQQLCKGIITLTLIISMLLLWWSRMYV